MIEAIAEIVGLSLVIALTFVTRTHAKKAADQATSVNDAVNHRHPDTPRLFDLVVSNKLSTDELLEWKRSYNDSPWKDGEGVRKWLEENKCKDCPDRKSLKVG